MKQIAEYITILTLLLTTGNAYAQGDTLARYIGIAASNNPLLKSEFTIYRASLQKIPQAGAYPDPQLEIGFFIKPMEIIDGKQIADFKLMQMFPWFGTKKAAGNEAAQMARMAFEKFRDTKDKLILDVKTTWYQLGNLQQRLITIRENKALLTVLKDLATSRFSAPGSQGAVQQATSAATPPPAAGVQTASGGMGGMGSMGAQPGQAAPPQSSGMGQMGGGSSMGGSSGGMSDVLRVQLELNELEDEEQGAISEITSAVAKFNTLLNRDPRTPVDIPQTVSRQEFILDDNTVMELIKQQNPMLRMAAAEADAYAAKLKMDKKMSLPMLGIGLQYSLIGKRMDMGIPVTDMNGMDMLMPMVTISIPIYRNKYKAQQKESKLMKQAAEEKYRGTLTTLTSGYISVKQQLDDAGRKVSLYERQAGLARMTYQLAVKEFAAGKAGMASVLDVQRQLLDYKFKRSESIATYNTIVAAIENLMSVSQDD